METVHSLKARYVFPVTSPPLENGMVTIADGRILSVGPDPNSSKILDLGNAAILPGLVNAHTHLEFSDLAAPVGFPGIGLAAWIRRLMEIRQNRICGAGVPPACTSFPSACAAETAAPQIIANGLEECLRCGVTAVGDIAQPDFPWDDPPQELTKFLDVADGDRRSRRSSSPGQRPGETGPIVSGSSAQRANPFLTPFLELIAPTKDRVPEALDFARSLIERHPTSSGSWRFGLSPHAPYTVHPALLDEVVSLSTKFKIPLAIHLAESREELELLAHQSGPLRELLEERGAWDPSAFSSPRRPMDILQVLAAAHHTLIIHGNYLQDDEIAFLARHPEEFSVAYCPRSHAWFGHDPYPLDKLLAAGVNVALGTDSRASAPNLDLLAEMRLVAEKFPQLPKETILRMGTLNGARALGHDRDLGSLTPGKKANLAVVALPDTPLGDPHDILFAPEARVVETRYRGKKWTV